MSFASVCDTLEEALGGSFRADVVQQLSSSPTLGAALARLREAMRTDIWSFGDARLTLALAVREYDRQTRSEGFHALHDWDGVAAHVNPETITVDVLDYIAGQRWYASKGTPVRRAKLSDHLMWEEGEDAWLIALIDLEGPEEPARYFVALAMVWEEQEEERARNLAGTAVARVRQQANVGVMGDAYADEPFCRAVLRAIAQKRELPTAQGTLHFRPTAAFAYLDTVNAAYRGDLCRSAGHEHFIGQIQRFTGQHLLTNFDAKILRQLP